MFESLLAGLFDALGGLYKDYPLEGFKIKVFPRSILFGLCVGIFFYFFNSNLSFIYQFLVSAYIVRALVEIKKWITAKGNYKEYWFKRIKERKKDV